MEKKHWIIIGIFTLLLLLLLGYGIYTKLNIQDETSTKIIKTIKNLLIAGFFLLLGFAAYKIYEKLTNKKVGQLMKTAIPDEQFELIKNRMIFREGFKGYYDKAGNLQFAKNSVIEGDERPFVSKGSGEEFLIKELFCRNPFTCPTTGARTLVIPLSREEKYVKGGLYATHQRTTMFDWLKNKSFLKKLALTTPQKESLRLALMDKDGDIDLEQYQNLTQQNQAQQPISTPSIKRPYAPDIEEFGGEE